MIRRAQATTGGAFRLEMADAVGTRTHGGALAAWSAERTCRAVQGREPAVFGVSSVRIAAAHFLPEEIADDLALRGEAGQGA